MPAPLQRCHQIPDLPDDVLRGMAMDLQPLVELKGRLENAAIAGVGLLGEDFRLKRAAEGLKPLAAASPVFGKIGQGLQGLLDAPPEERGGLLLDTLALVDAVLYTQGAAGKTSKANALEAGEFVPLSVKGGVYRELSYNQLHPLLEALTGSGGGRMAQIQDAWENHKEYFEDYRVLPKVIAGLGDSYGELAQLNGEILKAQSRNIVPLLKEGFDPTGKKGMARRVEAISALEGAKATPWLLEILPEAKKDVRAAVIAALGADPANTGLLLELAQTERGVSREGVLAALAKQDGEEIQAFWAGEIQSKPDSVKYLCHSQADWAADLAAAVLREGMEAVMANKERASHQDRLKLEPARWAIFGKASPAALDCWRWIDENLNDAGRMKDASGTVFSLSGEVVHWLLDSLCSVGSGPLCGLCLELWEKNRDSGRYLPHAVIAALLTRPAGEVYEEFAPHVKCTAKNRSAMGPRDVFNRLFWNREEGVYQVGEVQINRGFTLAEPLDPRWFDLMAQLPDMGYALERLTPPDDPALAEKKLTYQFRRILEGNYITQMNITFLREHGWKQWHGLLDKRVRQDGSLTLYAVTLLLNETSLTGPEKAAELRDLAEIVREQHAVNKRPLWPDQSVEKQIAAWMAE